MNRQQGTWERGGTAVLHNIGQPGRRVIEWAEADTLFPGCSVARDALGDEFPSDVELRVPSTDGKVKLMAVAHSCMRGEGCNCWHWNGARWYNCWREAMGVVGR